MCIALGACSAPAPPAEIIEEPTRTAAPPPLPQPTTTQTPAAATAWPAVPRRATQAHVTRIVDGDTVVLTGIPVGKLDTRTPGRHARLIGIDTPEVYGGVECYGRQASAFTTRELADQDVLVDFDVEPIDRYGRALVYIWKRDGTFFNGELAAQGYALQATFPPNVRYAELFTRLVRDARERASGLWAGCPNG